MAAMVSLMFQEATEICYFEEDTSKTKRQTEVSKGSPLSIFRVLSLEPSYNE